MLHSAALGPSSKWCCRSDIHGRQADRPAALEVAVHVVLLDECQHLAGRLNLKLASCTGRGPPDD